MQTLIAQLEKQRRVRQDIKQDGKNRVSLRSGNGDSGEDRGEVFERAIE